MSIEKIGRNVIIRREELPEDRKKVFLLLSDVHWDNPKCRRELLIRHLEQAVKRDARILINGDLFCLMQGRYDPRKNKADIRPEHNVNNYIDAVIDTAVEFFAPYAKHIDFIGAGNHETNILKRLETDVIQRFVAVINRQTGAEIKSGGYGGWYSYIVKRGKGSRAFNLKYHHGSGGNAQVTMGAIEFNRKKVFIEGADVIWLGHIHKDMELSYTSEGLTKNGRVKKRNTLMVRTSCYKSDYSDGAFGWGIERGFGPETLGGRWLEINYKLTDSKLIEFSHYSYKTDYFPGD